MCMSDHWTKAKGLREVADELVDRYFSESTAGRHDVSNEPRIPKGSPGGGRWTDGRSGVVRIASSKPIAIARGKTVAITYPDGSIEVRKNGSRAWRNNNPGNIEASSRANSEGAIGSDGRF